MRFTEEHSAFRKVVRDVVEREIAPYVDGWERDGTFPADALFPKLGELGLLGLEHDPEYGGQGADHLYTVILCEELTRAGAAGIPMAIGVQTCMATPSLHEFGSEELKRRYLAPAIVGTKVCSIAVTEAGAGSDVASIRTRAVRDGDEWLINGSKLYITNGTQADSLCLLARTSGSGGYRGMSQIVVETASTGLTVSRQLDKLGNRSSDTGSCLSRTSGFRCPTPSDGGARLPAADGAVRTPADVRRVRGPDLDAAGSAPHQRLPQAAAGVRQAAHEQPVPRLPARRAVGAGRPAASAELRVRRGVHGR